MGLARTFQNVRIFPEKTAAGTAAASFVAEKIKSAICAKGCANIIVATGLKTFDPATIPFYRYGELPDIVTSMEFEGMLKRGSIVKQDGTVAQSGYKTIMMKRKPDQ